MVNQSPGSPRRTGGRYGVNLLGQAAGRGIYLAAGFAAFVMIGHGAGPAVLGRYGLALAVLAVAVIAADFGTTLTFGARLGACRAEARARELARMLTARLVLGALAGLGLAAALPLLPAEIRPALLLAAVCMPLAAARFLDALFQVCGRPGWSSGPALANAVVLLGGTALALRLDAPEEALAAVAVAAGIAYGAVGLLLAGRLVPLALAPVRDARTLLRAAAGVGVSNALGSLNGRISLLMLAGAASAADLGRFTAGFRVFELGAAVAITLCAPLVPVFGRAVGPLAEGRPAAGTVALRARVRAALTPILAVTGAGMVAACALAEPLVRLLFGPDFAGSAPVVRVAAAMSAALIAATVLFAGLVPLGRSGFAVRGSACACLVNAAGCALLIPWDPVTGAALAALAAELAMLAVVAHAFHRAAGPPLAAADLPVALGPGLLAAAVWALGPAPAAPLAVPAVAALAASAAVAFHLRRPLPSSPLAPSPLVPCPLAPSPLPVPEASS